MMSIIHYEKWGAKIDDDGGDIKTQEKSFFFSKYFSPSDTKHMSSLFLLLR